MTVLDEDADPRDADLAVALGGDGTMLRTLARLLGSDVPVIGVNFGRVGFLAAIEPDGLERDLRRVFAGEYVVLELPTLEVQLDGETHAAVNDVVATSATLGRMVELAWAVGGEDLGTIPCDGMICATPSGSTAYNLSNGGPVLVRGLEAMAVTFIAPHSLHARPLVVPRGPDVTLVNRTPDVDVARARGRTARGRGAARRPGVRAAGGAAEPARDAAGDDVLRPLPRDVHLPPLTSRRPMVAVLRPLYTRSGAATAAHREPRPHPRGRARALARAERDHRRDGRRQDDPRPGGRPAARHEGRRLVRRPGGRGGLRRGGARPAGAGRGARRALRAAARGRGGAARRPGACSPTGAPARTPGAAPPRARTSPPRSSASSRCRASSSSGASRRPAVPARGARPLLRRGAARAAAPRPATAWRELLAARRRHEELTENAALAEARLAELRALVEDTEGMEPGGRGAAARRARARPPRRRARGGRRRGRPRARAGGRRGRGRPRRARRARGRAARGARAGAARGRRRAARRRAAPARDRLGAALVPRLARGGARPAGGDRGRPRPDRRGEAPLPRRDVRGAAGARRGGARGARGARRAAPTRPPRAARSARGGRGARRTSSRIELRAERNAAAPAFADAVAAELHDVGMGEGEFVCELRERDAGATGADEAVFLVRPNAGLPFAPVAETASGGELSRIALAIAAVAGGETLVFDEIDAGIGGETANAVGRVLQRLAERAQVITITHLPQIAALADRHFRVEKIPGDPTHTRIEQLADGERQRRARADARRPGVPCRGTQLTASCSRRSTTSGRSSPSRTTSPTGGRASRGVEPDRRGLAPGARWAIRASDVLPAASSRSGRACSGGREPRARCSCRGRPGPADRLPARQRADRRRARAASRSTPRGRASSSSSRPRWSDGCAAPFRSRRSPASTTSCRRRRSRVTPADLRRCYPEIP